ncbi:MAG: metallophosphoesterase [Clostridia bacterium]|nr:metallophosphoesterase [Clostridia bacterium]
MSAEIRSLFETCFERKGCRNVAGPMGGEALQFHNPAGEFASDYIKTDAVLPAEDFTVRVWMRTYACGCNGVCISEAALPGKEGVIDPAKRTPLQAKHGGAVLTNHPCRVFSTGLSLQVNQPQSYFTVNFKTDAMQEPIQLRGMRQCCDDVWHLIAVSVARKGDLCVYCDGKLLRSADISAYAGQSLGAQKIVLGADTQGLYGLGKVDLAELSLLEGAVTAEDAAREYEDAAVRALAYEIRSRNLEKTPVFEGEAAEKLLEKVRETEEKLSLGHAPGALLTALQAAYEEMLLHTVKPDAKLLVVADTHCAEAGNHRTEAFRNALCWANELGMDGMLHGGDYSQYGRECDFEGFWNVMRENFKGKPFFLTVGNHETLHNDAQTLARRQCDWLREFGMVGEDHKTMYYDGEVNGYHVLTLAQYYDYEVTGYKLMWQFAGKIGREQLDWIREKLNAYCGQGKPVFLVIHNSHGPLLEKQTEGGCMSHSKILHGEELYELMRQYKDVVLCTGHVHHGLGELAGLFPIDGYHVLDIPGFKNSTYGYGYDESKPDAEVRHCGYFAYLFGRTVLLRAADFANRRWLPVYDQLVTLP